MNKSENTDGIFFISPDKSTKIVIKPNKILVFDSATNKLLKSVDINFNKVLMSEYAIGNYAKKWKSEF